MIDTLLLRPSLHFTQLHLTALHYTCRHFTSSHLNFTTYTTLSFGLTPFKFPTAPFHLTSLHFTALHCTFRRFSPHFCSFNFTPCIMCVVFLLSLHRARQLYHAESLHPPGYPLTAAVLRTAMEVTPFVFCMRRLSHRLALQFLCASIN